MTMDRQIILGPSDGERRTNPGLLITTKAEGKDTDGAFAALEFKLAPRFPGLPPHIHHNEDETFYVLEGTVQIRLGDQTFEAKPGSFILQPRGVIHTFSNPSDSVARILAINSPPGLEGYFRAITEATESFEPQGAGSVDLQKRLALAPEYGLEILIGR